MDAGDLRMLLSPAGLALLDDVTGSLGELGDAVQAVRSLRAAGHDPRLVAAVLTQARLRERARAKLGPFAAEMLFTEAGLEQSTRLRIAALHAGRFRDAGMRRVADLGCGIGADAMALASLGLDVVAVERDEVTAAVAAFNLRPWPNARVEHGDATSTSLQHLDAIWLDPARRDGAGRRSHDPADWSPSLDWAFEVAHRIPAGIKLGPGLDRAVIPDDVEAQWITAGRETVELVLWSGALRRDGVRRAALVLGDDRIDELVAAADAPDPDVRALGDWLYEPDGAVIRARLIGELANRLDAGLVSAQIAYLTSDAAIESPFAQRFRVLDVLPLDAKRLARALNDRGIGTLEIKKRGVDLDPAAFRKRLRLRGDGSATLIATRVDGRHRAILAERA